MIRPCLFCAQLSESWIPEGRVCHQHAVAFYTGLVAFAIDRTREIVAPLPRYALFARLPPRVGARPTRPYVKRHPKWFTGTGTAAA